MSQRIRGAALARMSLLLGAVICNVRAAPPRPAATPPPRDSPALFGMGAQPCKTLYGRLSKSAFEQSQGVKPAEPCFTGYRLERQRLVEMRTYELVYALQPVACRGYRLG